MPLTHYEKPAKKITITHGGTDYQLEDVCAQLTIDMVENAVWTANMILTDEGADLYDNKVGHGDLTKIYVNYLEAENPLTSASLRFHGFVEDYSPVLTTNGEYLQVMLRPYGRCLVDMACGQQYGAYSRNNTLDTIAKILTNATNGIIPLWVNRLLGNTAAPSGYNLDTTQVQTILGTIPYVDFPYKPPLNCLDDLIDMVQAIKGASTAGAHWIVKPEESGGVVTNYLIVDTVGNHASAKWPTWWNTDQANSTIVVKQDMIVQQFTKQRPEANYVLYAGNYRHPGDGDRLSDDHGGASLWTSCVNPNTCAINNSTTAIVGSHSLLLEPNNAPNIGGAFYPNGRNLAIDFAKISTPLNIPRIGLYLRANNTVALGFPIYLATDSLICGGAADHYFWAQLDQFVKPVADKWFLVDLPIGPHYALDPSLQRGDESTQFEWNETGSPSWSNINMIVLLAGNQNTFDVFFDGLNLNGHLMRGAKKLSPIADVAKAYAVDVPTWTDETTAATDNTPNDMTLLPATPAVDDAYVFGANTAFSTLQLNVGTAGVGNWTITWEYLTSGGWGALSGVSDGTNGFRVAGTNSVTFTLPAGWSKQTLLGNSLYWIRGRVSAYVDITTQPLGTRAYTLDNHEDYYKVKVITDHVAKDDTLNASDDSGTMAQIAYAELLRASRTPIMGEISIPGKPTILPGQKAHIHAVKTSVGTFRIDKDMRITRHRLVLTGSGFISNLSLTDDLYNGRPMDPTSAYNIVRRAADVEYQNRQMSSVKAWTIDTTQTILEKTYAFASIY